MIMGIDHGYYAIKTRHFKFPAGVAVYSHEPYTLKNTLQVNGKYYVCGTGRQPILRDKTINDNYYILTLAAIAMELRYRGLPAESSVTLAAGLPLARYGRDKKPFTEYLLRNGQPVTFRFEGERYKIKIEDVKLFPQGYLAIAVRPDLVKNEPSILLTIEGNGDGNGQVPPGQHEDEDGTIVNPGGNVAPGLNRGEKIDKPANPNKPEKPNKPGSEDKEDKKVNKAQQGTHIYTYDELNRMVTSDVSKVFTNYTYDTLGNLVLETVKNKSVDYEYNELNQLMKRTTTENETFTYSYDKRGNRVAETGKKESREYVYDATNRLVEGTNWKGDKSAYTYNGLGLRVNNLVTTHAGKTYDRDYVIDYTSPENDDLYVYAMGNGQLEYEQRHVYAGSERLEQITEKGTGGWERTLYVHEDVMGNTRYYTKATGQNFAELQYDAWGQPVSPNKLVNNDHGNYVFATFTGHIYDTTLDVYFAEARFYDAITRTWMAMDPIKSGLNWYQYVGGNPVTYYDPKGEVASETIAAILAVAKKIAPYVVGAVSGVGISHLGMKLEESITGVEFSDQEFMMNSIVFGVAGAYVASSSGAASSPMMLAGGIFGGVVSKATGEPFMNGVAGGLIAGAVPSVAGAALGSVYTDFLNVIEDDGFTLQTILTTATNAALSGAFSWNIDSVDDLFKPLISQLQLPMNWITSTEQAATRGLRWLLYYGTDAFGEVVKYSAGKMIDYFMALRGSQATA